MQKFNASSPRKALLLATTFGLGIALTGCTSIELAEQDRKPSVTATQTVAISPTGAVEQSEVAQEVEKAEALTTEVAANALSSTKDGSNSAAQAITQAAAPTVEQPKETAAEVSKPKFDETKIVKADFPPRPGHPSTPSAAPVPLTMEMMQAQNVVPAQKPRVPELAYAAAPTNAAIAAIAEDQEQINNPKGPVLRGRSHLNSLISKYAKLYNVPESLVHRVVQRESTYNPSAYNSGNYGLMQIRLGTAKGLGFKGTSKDLFDAETNLKYAVKYLRGALLVADNNHDQAIRLYARGYYYDAKRKGMLHVLR